LKSINFLHSAKWVSFFVNAFIKQGKKQLIESMFQKAQLFARLVLHWTTDTAKSIAAILEMGKPIFRFVVFERKMKKRKRKTWTVPKLLWKDRGFVWGARVLWLNVTADQKEFKFLSRLISVIDRLADPGLLYSFTNDKFKQTRRAGRLRRWMRFLRGRFKRPKLRSVYKFKDWWKYRWFDKQKLEWLTAYPKANSP
jgi:hypothetical protein